MRTERRNEGRIWTHRGRTGNSKMTVQARRVRKAIIASGLTEIDFISLGAGLRLVVDF